MILLQKHAVYYGGSSLQRTHTKDQEFPITDIFTRRIRQRIIFMATSPPLRFSGYAHSGCPVEAALEMFGGKWKGMILYHLLDGPIRFNALQRMVGSVTQRMLTKQLRELEACGLVRRTVYAEVPPRVEYSLTPKGQTLAPILRALRDWGQQHAMQDKPGAPAAIMPE
jgi:DNA-binding HxlR family transcriptional regulator